MTDPAPTTHSSPATSPDSASARSRPRWLVAGWLLVVAALCAGLFVATYLLAVHTHRGRLLDGASLRGAVESRSPVTSVIEQVLNVVTVTSLVAAAVVVAMIALLRLRRDLAVAAIVVMIGSNVTAQVLKRYVLSRPDLGLTESTPSTLNSLPSGHSTVAFSVAVALVLVLPSRLRPVAVVLGVAYASATAFATLSAGWHRPSDSLAAFFLVGAWAAVAEALVLLRNAPASADGGTDLVHADTTRRLARVAAYLLAIGCLLAVIVVTLDLNTYGTPAQILAYVAAAAGVTGTAAALMAALVAVLGRVVSRSREPSPRARMIPPRVAHSLEDQRPAG